MKTIKVIAVILGLFLANNLMGQFGPPEPTSKKGLSFGIAYAYYSNSLTIQEHDWGAPIKQYTEDFSWDTKILQKMPYLQANYKTSYGDVYVRLGEADLKLTDVIEPTGRDLYLDSIHEFSQFNGDLKPFVSMGVEKNFSIVPGLSLEICPFVEMTLYMKNKDEISKTILDNPNIRIQETKTQESNLSNLNMGFSLQKKIGRTMLYCGPTVYWTMGSLKYFKITDYYNHATKEFVQSVIPMDCQIREKSNFGGFCGLWIPLIKGFNLGIIGQWKNTFSLGSSLTFQL